MISTTSDVVSLRFDNGVEIGVLKLPPFPKTEARRLGKKIAKLRVEKGLSQERLAETAGLAARHLQRLEAGTGSTSLGTLSALKRALHVTWSELFAEI
jgi:DNA-binding XRE family transcriptional regulator